VLDNLSEQTTAEKSAAKTALDIKALRKQGVNRSSLHLCNCSHHLPSCAYSSSGAVAVAVVRRSCSRIDVGVINCNCNCISQRLLHAAAQMIGPSMHKVIQVVYTHARAAVHIAAVCRQPQSFHELSRTSGSQDIMHSLCTLDNCTMAATDSRINKTQPYMCHAEQGPDVHDCYSNSDWLQCMMRRCWWSSCRMSWPGWKWIFCTPRAGICA